MTTENGKVLKVYKKSPSNVLEKKYLSKWRERERASPNNGQTTNDSFTLRSHIETGTIRSRIGLFELVVTHGITTKPGQRKHPAKHYFCLTAREVLFEFYWINQWDKSISSAKPATYTNAYLEQCI